MLGAYLTKNDKGIEFKVGTGFTDDHRKNRLPIGTKITYQYGSVIKASQKPRFPIYKRVREDP